MKLSSFSALSVLVLAWGGGMAHAQAPEGSPRDAISRATGQELEKPPILNQADVEGHNGGRGSMVYAGFDLLILRPQFTKNPAFTENSRRFINSVTGNPPVSTTNFQSISNTPEFDYDWSVSPRIWLGFQSECGLGARARWFHFDQAADSRTSIEQAAGVDPPGPGFDDSNTSAFSALGGVSNFGSNTNFVGGTQTRTDTGTGRPLQATSSLFLDVGDAELTYTIQGGHWSIIFAGGGRYLYMEQTYSAVAPARVRTDSADGVLTRRDSTDASVTSRQTFTGGGPTVALDALFRLGDSNLALYGTGRGSILFGRGRQTISSNSVTLGENLDFAGVVTSSSVSTSSSQNTNSGRDILSVLEIELGVQWSREIGRWALFVRPGILGHLYIDGGSGSSREDNFGLFGLVVTAGVGY